MDKAARDRTMLVAAAALTDGSGRVLVQQHAAGQSMAGLWEFPGGKVEADEGPREALARELGEELGIAVDMEALVPIGFSTAAHGTRTLVLLLFGCRSWSGVPRPLDAAALDWCDAAGLRALAMPPADVPLINPLARWLGL